MLFRPTFVEAVELRVESKACDVWVSRVLRKEFIVADLPLRVPFGPTMPADAERIEGIEFEEELRFRGEGGCRSVFELDFGIGREGKGAGIEASLMRSC